MATATKPKSNSPRKTKNTGTGPVVKEKTAEGQDKPLLDLSDAAVKRMIKAAKKRGFVTVDQLNAVMPSDEVSSEQIEDIMAMLSDMGINVVEEEDVEDDAASRETDRRWREGRC